MLSRPITQKDLLIFSIVLIMLLATTNVAGARTNLAPPGPNTVPAGAVMFFDLGACPQGWAEFTTAQGRYLVGLPSGGTLGATVGTSLSDQEDRPVGQHNHTVTDAGHIHTITDPGHNHSSSIFDMGHSHTAYDLGHAHSMTFYDSGDGWGVPTWDMDSSDPIIMYTDVGYANIVVNTGHASISATINNNTTGIGINLSPTGILVDDAGLVAGTNAPYVQLLACKKN